MIVDVRQWLRGMWPTKAQAVLSDYASLRLNKFLLADIALRGLVFGPCHVPGDPYTSAVNEGRRQMALEIIKLADEDPQRLFALIEKSSTPAERDRARGSMT